MSDSAIKIESVSKRYELGTRRSEGLFSQDLERRLRAPFRRLLGRGPEQLGTVGEEMAPVSQEFWALRDVSFEVEPGGVLGLIGSNGAGKSTLLKLLSRITLPTAGKITMHGRIGTLLEVGTGFHPELTGRENIFLNGAILGMRRREITAAFDDIVEFSGIEQFLDTPVKRYSSGMYVRLAFAVAAHLQPEILLVDEVLAVGDTEFQQKCIGKMGDVARAGRTVVFVSHNLSAVQRLCDRTVWLHQGKVMDDGLTQDVIGKYLKQVTPTQHEGEAHVDSDVPRVGTGEAQLVRASIRGADGNPIDTLELGAPFHVTMAFEVNEPIRDVIIELGISSADGTRAATALSLDAAHGLLELQPGVHEFTVDLDVALHPGEYWIEIGIHDEKRSFDHIERVLNFASLDVPHPDAGLHPWPRGFVRMPSRWSGPDLGGSGAQERVAPLLDREQ